MKRLFLLLGFLLAHEAGAEDAALRAVDACRARLDPRVDIGIERVERRCPELLAALEKAPWRDLLPSTLGARREEISAESLRALADLVRRASGEGARRAAPDPEILSPVLAELGDQGQQGSTRWERFKRWLEQKIRDRKDKEEPGWLERWSRQLQTPEGVAQAITYIGYALVIALVLFVIGSELRAAGLLGGMRRGGSRSSPAAEWRRRLMLADVLAAPPSERPGMLLKLLGEALTRAHRLPASEGLTAAAIARRANLDTEADRDDLTQVAVTAESVRYSPLTPDDEALDRAVVNARRLLGRVARAPAERR
jgi:hypothetical protein